MVRLLTTGNDLTPELRDELTAVHGGWRYDDRQVQLGSPEDGTVESYLRYIRNAHEGRGDREEGEQMTRQAA